MIKCQLKRFSIFVYFIVWIILLLLLNVFFHYWFDVYYTLVPTVKKQQPIPLIVLKLPRSGSSWFTELLNNVHNLDISSLDNLQGNIKEEDMIVSNPMKKSDNININVYITKEIVQESHMIKSISSSSSYNWMLFPFSNNHISYENDLLLSSSIIRSSKANSYNNTATTTAATTTSSSAPHDDSSSSSSTASYYSTCISSLYQKIQKHLILALQQPTPKFPYFNMPWWLHLLSGRFREDYLIPMKFLKPLNIVGFTVNPEHFSRIGGDTMWSNVFKAHPYARIAILIRRNVIKSAISEYTGGRIKLHCGGLSNLKHSTRMTTTAPLEKILMSGSISSGTSAATSSSGGSSATSSRSGDGSSATSSSSGGGSSATSSSSGDGGATSSSGGGYYRSCNHTALTRVDWDPVQFREHVNRWQYRYQSYYFMVDNIVYLQLQQQAQILDDDDDDSSSISSSFLPTTFTNTTSTDTVSATTTTTISTATSAIISATTINAAGATSTTTNNTATSTGVVTIIQYERLQRDSTAIISNLIQHILYPITHTYTHHHHHHHGDENNNNNMYNISIPGSIPSINNNAIKVSLITNNNSHESSNQEYKHKYAHTSNRRISTPSSSSSSSSTKRATRRRRRGWKKRSSDNLSHVLLHYDDIYKSLSQHTSCACLLHQLIDGTNSHHNHNHDNTSNHMNDNNNNNDNNDNGNRKSNNHHGKSAATPTAAATAATTATANKEREFQMINFCNVYIDKNYQCHNMTSSLSAAAVDFNKHPYLIL